MFDSLWQVLTSVSLLWISLDLIGLRREVKKCLRILYEAVEADPEGGDVDA